MKAGFFIKRVLLVISMLLLFTSTWAVQTQTFSHPLQGSSLAAGAVMNYTEVPYYKDTAVIAREYGVKATISFSLNEKLMYATDGTNFTDFTFGVVFDVHYLSYNGTETTISNQSLTVAYKKGGGDKFKTVDRFAFEGNDIKRLWIVVQSIDPHGATWDPRNFLSIVGELSAKRDFVFNCQSASVVNLNVPSNNIATDGFFVNWSDLETDQNKLSYTHYDIEWAWIDENLISDYYVTGTNTLDATRIFLNNATRVTIEAGYKQYNIPTIYDGSGFIFYRVRPVQLTESGITIAGKWSSDGIDPLQYQFSFNGHEDNLNWQSTTSFAEEGKRKTVIQYFDGSLRARQTVTKDNETGNTIIAETFYDYQGRPALQVLPAPTLDKVLKYAHDFNQFNDAGSYPKELYDHLNAANTNSCISGAPVLSTSSGTGLYYSPQNTEKSTGFNQYIPDAQGNVFSETIYTPDNTGRIAAQGGVGAAHGIGSGHETKYFYGTADQKELDALFGTEAGDASHYFKNMVRDANGQYSVSYVDMHGRTVATALAGSSPNNIQALNSNPGSNGSMITKNLLDAGSNIVKNKSIQSSKSLTVPLADNYEFKYHLSPLQLSMLTCTNSTDVYNCLYDLEIIITDACGNVKLNVNQQAQTSFSIDNYVLLDEGEYNITKTLTINQASQENYKFNTFLPHNTCKTLQDFINEYTILYRNQNNNCNTILSSSFNKLQAIRIAMIQDMVPYTGQYANGNGGPFDIFTYSSDLGIVPYQNPCYLNGSPGGAYNNELGQTNNNVYIPGPNGQQVTTDVDVFVRNFNDTWAEQLLPYHLEYPKLTEAQNNLATSFAYDDNLEATQTYTDALNKGYLMGSADAYLNNDPFFSNNNDPSLNSAPGHIYYNAMRDKMNSYVIKTHDEWQWTWTGWGWWPEWVTVEDYHLSMWQLASTSVSCRNLAQSLQESCAQSQPLWPAGIAGSSCTQDQTNEWLVFRSLYLTEKDKLVNQYLDTKVTYNRSDIKSWYNYALHFDDASSTANPYTDPNQIANYQAGINSQLDAQYDENCRSNTARWTSILNDCPQIAALDATTRGNLINDVIEGFVQICKTGCSVTNPFGTSSNTNGASFKTVLATVFSNYGLSADAFCNAYLFDWPKQYNAQPALAQQEITTPPSPGDCICTRLTQLSNEAVLYHFTSNASSAGNISEYLSAYYNTTISAADIATLQAACNGSTTCNFLQHPVNIPPVLQCQVNPAAVCITCTVYQNNVTAFKQEFTDAIYQSVPYPPSDNLTQQQVDANTFFAKFMNYQTGFSKSWTDYYDFNSSCTNGNSAMSSVSTYRVCTNCGVTATPDFGPRLCGSAAPVFPEVQLPADNPCNDYLKMATYAAKDAYEIYLQQLKGNFDIQYTNRCLAAQQSETFTVTHKVAEYHYTLYYYDQAGNLIKTVPPNGVVADFSDGYDGFLNQVAIARAAGIEHPNDRHTMVTRYCYNTLNQVVSQKTPDGGLSFFWYDRLGRLAISQNAKQAIAGNYSYTLYDALGRIKEVGEKPAGSNAPMSQSISRDQNALYAWVTGGGTARQQITRTVYDLSYTALCNSSSNSLFNPFCQYNLRNRVSYSMVIPQESGAPPDVTVGGWASATFYNYDIHGNVNKLLHSFREGAMASKNEYKLIQYDYDLISGKVNHVAYQPGFADEFYHRYDYDAENRLLAAYTSDDDNHWERDAAYSYYRHGPLARTILGENQVQGVDYAYTLQGWLKGVNSNTAGTGQYDMGQDGYGTGGNANIAADVFAYSLNYHSNDYTPIGNTAAFTNILTGIQSQQGGVNTSLYNGNIAAMALHVPKLGDAKVYAYGYDQLNRLVKMDAYNGLSNNNFIPAYTDEYKERISYDANGNILTYLRNGTTRGGSLLAMDNLTYQYEKNSTGQILSNKLRYVHDQVPETNYSEDIDSQTSLTLSQVQRDNSSAATSDNYRYDDIGNLIHDEQAKVDINWTVYGKISSVTKTDGTTITYSYDAAGNRISKTVKNQGGTILRESWYVRDAQGNVLSLYDKSSGANNNHLTQSEVHLYGSSRLGIYNRSVDVDPPVVKNAQIITNQGNGWYFTEAIPYTNKQVERGNKFFELSNHLGNVLATVSDRREWKAGNWQAFVNTATDYYPFGMAMPGRNGKALTGGGWAGGNTTINNVSVAEDIAVDSRTANTPAEYKAANSISFTNEFASGNTNDEFSAYIADATNTTGSSSGTTGGANGTDAYRYGFNGKENDKDISEGGQDYGMRIYDERIGRFLSTDPITGEYPELTPYQFASNTPIQAIDLDGLEAAMMVFPQGTSSKDRDAAIHAYNQSLSGFVEGFGGSAWGTVKSSALLTSTVPSTESIQAKSAMVHSVTHPKETIKNIKAGFKQWTNALKSSDPYTRSHALGQGVEFLAELEIPVPPIMKGLKIPYLSGKFIIGAKTLARISEHLEQFGVKAENTIMLERMQKIAKGEMKATEIDINFAKHELRESELMKAGKTYEEAHEAVLKEQNMYHRNYEKKLYTEDAIKAGNAQMEKEVTKLKKGG